MKQLHFYTIVLLLAFGVVSCRKEEQRDTQEETDATFTGTWELTQSYGGMMPLTNYAAGTGNLLSFTETEFTDRRNGHVVQQGGYRLVSDSTVDLNSCARVAPKDAKPNTIIISNNPAGYRQYFQIKGNTLKIWSGCMALDGGASIYKKVVILR